MPRMIPTLGRVVEVGKELRSLATLPERFERELERINNRLDAVTSKLEGCDQLAADLTAAKRNEAYYRAYDKPEPLVTVCIATFNRAELLLTRSLPSLISQTHKNLQILVVGDSCTDDTAQRMAGVRDSRVSFTNLETQGKYPLDPHSRWMVAGSAAMNEALRQAEGDFVAHLDDDDENLPDRVATLVERIQTSRADLVWHPFWRQYPDGWLLTECAAFKRRHVGTGNIFYHRWFARIPWDLEAYRLEEPGDWNRLRKLKYAGVQAVREPTPLSRHFREAPKKA